jgi:hypothetical protein
MDWLRLLETLRLPRHRHGQNLCAQNAHARRSSA